MPFKRRDFLRTAAVAAAGSLVGCGPSDELDELDSSFSGLTSIDTNLGKFPQGSWAGSMTTDTVVLTTRYARDAAPPHLRVWKVDPHQLVFDGLPGTDDYKQGWYYRLLTSNTKGAPGYLELEPNTKYRYRFYERGGGARTDGSRSGTFSTLARGGSHPIVRFAAGSCNLAVKTPLPVLEDVGSEPNLDFFIHMGDSIYADITGHAMMGHHPTTEAEFNRVYQEYWDNDGFRDLHAATGFMSIWDDHEFRNNQNAPDYQSPGGRAARAAYLMHHGLRPHANDPTRLWRSFRHGDTAEFFLLDLRSERRPAAKEIMSQQQMNWLKQGLEDSTASFKIIIAPQPLMQFPDGHSCWGFTPQREELLNKVAHLKTQGKQGFFFLGGDVHLAAAGRINDRGPFNDLQEFVIGPLGNPGNGMSPARRASFQRNTGARQQLHFTSGYDNAAIFTLRPPSGKNGAELDVKYVVAASNVDHAGHLTRREVRYRATYGHAGARRSVAIDHPDTVMR